MAKTRAERSQSQVLVYCNSVQEAEKLQKVLQTYEVDTVDDALASHQALELELKAIQDDRINLLDRIAKLEAKNAPKKAEVKPHGVEVKGERSLGSKKGSKK